MLVATRDPPLHPGVQPAPPPAATPGTGLTRLMNVLQVAGALLAIPVGLVSGYSVYHANFSSEARCQGLRANIVSMLDKSADASTLRMLVHRDVAAFEQSCGAVDPDAVAAFKTLLSADKPAAAAAATHAAAAKPPAKPAVAKTIETKPAESNPVPREASDARWLASVREALVSHRPEAVKPAEPVEPAAAARLTPPVAAPAAPPLPAPITPPMHATAAPALPAPVVSVSRPDADHPVPPALIPETSSVPVTETPSGSRLGTLLTRVPLVGGMFGR